MNCRKARRLLELSADEVAICDGRHPLATHLHACPACRAYRRRLQFLDDAIRADGELLSARTPVTRFEDRLHRALQVESGKLASGPAWWLSRTLTTTPRLRALGRALNAAAALVAAACLALTLLSVPQHRPAECRFGHIASLSVKRLPDGRVVASQTHRGTPGRACLNEEHRP